MNTATLNFGMYEALVDIGVKPELARNVERKLEAALLGQQEAFRVQSRDELMTKADGEKLRTEIHTVKADLLKTINDQTWKLISYVAVLNALLVAAMKLLLG